MAVAVAVSLSGPGPPKSTTTTTTTTAASGPGPPAQPPPATTQFGANVNLLLEDPSFTAAQRERGLSELRAAGGTLARTDALWEATEPQPPNGGRHRYDWTFNDRIASALASHGLDWLPVIDYSPWWAQSLSGVGHSPPRSPGDYAAYASAFAARYGPGGVFWSAHPQLTPHPVSELELWNEPDNSAFWKPGPDPGRYGVLYSQARAAIAAVSPSVRVLIGGLTAGGASRFMAALLAADPALSGHIDGISIHPYGHTPALVLDRVRHVRAALRELGIGEVPLYVTEVGWTTQPRGWLDYLRAPLRPGYLAATLDQLGHLDCEVSAVLVYTWVSQERDPANGEQWYGIAPPAGGQSAATKGFALGILGGEASGPRLPC